VAEARLRTLSVAVVLALLALGGLFLSVTEDLAGALLWGGLIAIGNLVSVRTPSGERIRLGIGVAVGASILLEESIALAAAYAIGMAAAWLIDGLRHRPSAYEDGDYVAETLAVGVYGLVYSAVLEAALQTTLTWTWAVLVAVTAGGLAWFLTRAVVRALVGLERPDLSPRYLWLLALEDWAAVISVFAAGTLFGLTWDVMGLWAIFVAILPYSFTARAFEQYHTTRVTYGQTIRALAQIPEVAGLASAGHATRTADLAVAVGQELGLHPHDVDDLEFSALMHDVGRITLSEPAILKAGFTDEDIARWGAQIIAEAPYLHRVAELVEEQHRPFRTPGVERDPDVPVPSKVIKVSSAYDHAVHELGLRPVEALERIHQGSAYEFDPIVAASLRRVLVHRGDVPV
jgi:hypothetical protein